jgi:hypothetical protein
MASVELGAHLGQAGLVGHRVPFAVMDDGAEPSGCQRLVVDAVQ